jgi:hypothetical protein
MTANRPLTEYAASAGGALLSAATRSLAAARPAAKPLHPVGRVTVARLLRRGPRPATGIPLLDGSTEERVLIRESRAVGLPSPLPDIHGLAIRVTNPDGSDGDLLLATTGWGRLTRFVLTASVTPYGRPLTTLLPYRTDLGPVLLGARRADDTDVVQLAYAVGAGAWRFIGDLVMSDEDPGDPTISFDPVAHPVTGLDQYVAVDRLRGPAYRTARRSRQG